MEDLIAAIIGIVLMLAFAGGLAWMIGSPPLLIISRDGPADGGDRRRAHLREEARNARS